MVDPGDEAERLPGAGSRDHEDGTERRFDGEALLGKRVEIHARNLDRPASYSINCTISPTDSSTNGILRTAPMALTVRTAHSPAATIARTLELPVLIPGGLRRFSHVLVEELERRAVRRDVVLLLDEPVALVGKHHILRHAAAAPHRLHDLVGLDLQHPRIVRSLKHQH